MTFEQAVCKKCGYNNPSYLSICKNCKSYLRERTVNLDLWNTILLIIEEPETAFKQIIFAEHKNFIFLLTFFIAIKNLIVARFISVTRLGLDGVTTSFIFSLILSIIVTILMLCLIAFIQKKLLAKKNIQLRFKDYYAINVYSFIPYLFGIFFIFPIELTVLGGDIFSNNPYAFQIKPTITYLLIGFEVLSIIWFLFLANKNIFSVTKKVLFSIMFTTAFCIGWFASLYLLSLFIFTL